MKNHVTGFCTQSYPRIHADLLLKKFMRWIQLILLSVAGDGIIQAQDLGPIVWGVKYNVTDYVARPVTGGSDNTQVWTIENGFPDLPPGSITRFQKRTYNQSQTSGVSSSEVRTRKFYTDGTSRETFVRTPTAPGVDYDIQPSSEIEAYELGYWNYQRPVYGGTETRTHTTSIEYRSINDCPSSRFDQVLITVTITATDLDGNPIPYNQISIGGLTCNANGQIRIVANLGTTIPLTPTVAVPAYKFYQYVNSERIAVAFQGIANATYDLPCGTKLIPMLAKSKTEYWTLGPPDLNCTWGVDSGVTGGWRSSTTPPVEILYSQSTGWVGAVHTYKTAGQKRTTATGTIYGQPIAVYRDINIIKPTSGFISTDFSGITVGNPGNYYLTKRLGRLPEMVFVPQGSYLREGWQAKGLVPAPFQQGSVFSCQVIKSASADYLGGTGGVPVYKVMPGVPALDGTVFKPSNIYSLVNIATVGSDSPNINLFTSLYTYEKFDINIEVTFFYAPESGADAMTFAVPFAKSTFSIKVAATQPALGSDNWTPVSGLSANIPGTPIDTSVYPTWDSVANPAVLNP